MPPNNIHFPRRRKDRCSLRRLPASLRRFFARREGLDTRRRWLGTRRQEGLGTRRQEGLGTRRREGLGTRRRRRLEEKAGGVGVTAVKQELITLQVLTSLYTGSPQCPRSSQPVGPREAHNYGHWRSRFTKHWTIILNTKA